MAPGSDTTDKPSTQSHPPGTGTVDPDDPVHGPLARIRRGVTADRVFLAVVVTIWVMLYVLGLGDQALRVWDESRYAVPARNMVASGDWLTPRLQVNTHAAGLETAPRLVKPPLIYWLQAGAMSVLGVTVFAARLPTALAALGCAVLVYHIGRTTRDRRAALAGSLAFLVFPGMLVGSHGGRAAVPDTTLALFGSLFVWLTWRARDEPSLLLPGGVAAGLAVMTKGVAAGVFVVVVLPLVLLAPRVYRTPWTAAGVAATVVVALPWHLWASLAHGEQFVEQYLERAVLSRVTGRAGTDAAPVDPSPTGDPTPEPLFEFMNYPYLRDALAVFAPPYDYWLPVFGVAIVLAFGLLARAVYRDGREAHTETLVVAWWALAVPATFALVGGNKPWYVLPMYLPGSVLLGHLVATTADGVERRLGRRRSEGPEDGAGTAADGGSSAAAGGATTRQVAYVVVCLLLAAVLVGNYAPPPTNDYDTEQRGLGEAIAAETPADATVYVSLGETVPRRSLMSLPFYADRDYARTTTARLERDPPGRFALVPLVQVDRLPTARVLARAPENGLAFVAFERTDRSVADGRPPTVSLSVDLFGTSANL